MPHTPPCCLILALPLSGQTSLCTSTTHLPFLFHLSLLPAFSLITPACIYVLRALLFPFPSLSSPLTPPVYTLFLRIISAASLPPPSISWVLCFTEAGCPNPLWHSYLNLHCYRSFHPTAPTLLPLSNNSPTPPPPFSWTSPIYLSLMNGRRAAGCS